MSGPLLSKCQMVAWVASLRDPVEMALFDFSSLSLAPWAQPFSPRPPSHPPFVQAWYADRLTLKSGSHGDEKGSLTSPGTRQIPMQELSAILKSCPRINRQSTFTYDLFSPLNKDTQVLSAILHTHSTTNLTRWRQANLRVRGLFWKPLLHVWRISYDFVYLFCNLDSEETEAKPNIYYWFKVCETQGHSYVPAKL